MMDRAEFEALWKALNQQITPLGKRLAAVEAQRSRAEVAGAVEVVAALPVYGQAGRLLFVTGDGLYVDLGTGWGKVTVTV